MTTIKALADRHCRPLSGDEHRLSDAALAEGLAALPGWSLEADGTGITRTFRFPDYHRTMAYVNALAFVAHREDHHPDLGVHYDRVVVRYSTHDVGGLSENDLVCAAKATQLAEG
jgi:4a-hydroxytetrahydrobiopterin dehydratase